MLIARRGTPRLGRGGHPPHRRHARRARLRGALADDAGRHSDLMDRIRAIGNTAVDVTIRLAHHRSPYTRPGEKGSQSLAERARRHLNRDQAKRTRLMDTGRPPLLSLRSPRDQRRLTSQEVRLNPGSSAPARKQALHRVGRSPRSVSIDSPGFGGSDAPATRTSKRRAPEPSAPANPSPPSASPHPTAPRQSTHQRHPDPRGHPAAERSSDAADRPPTTTPANPSSPPHPPNDARPSSPITRSSRRNHQRPRRAPLSTFEVPRMRTDQMESLRLARRQRLLGVLLALRGARQSELSGTTPSSGRP